MKFALNSGIFPGTWSPAQKLEATARVGADGLAAIGRMKGLTHLSLANQNVTDRQLRMLGNLPRLKYLNVKNADSDRTIDPATVMELQRRGVQVYGQPAVRQSNSSGT